jgi:hypothetical protein
VLFLEKYQGLWEWFELLISLYSPKVDTVLMWIGHYSDQESGTDYLFPQFFWDLNETRCMEIATVLAGFFWIYHQIIPKAASSSSFFFFFFFGSTLVWTQGLHLSVTPPAFFCDGFFWDRVSWTICPSWLWTTILLNN